MKRSNRTLFLLATLFFFHLPLAAQSTYFTHTIAKGETVYAIARIYGVSPQEILALNPDAQNGIQTGTQLRIPQKQAGQQGKRFHTIAAGETLYRITQLYKVSATDICNANPGLSAENFQAGKVIVIPATTAVPAATVATPKPADRTDSRPQGLANSNCREMHKVARKETIAGIARQYGISERELMTANPEMKQPGYKLKKGTFVCIPYPRPVQKPEPPAPSNAELFPAKATAAPMARIRMGVILPLKEKNNRGAKMVEFYQGLLLAVDSVKNEGTSIDIHTFDSGSSLADMQKLLTNPSLASLDIIFGPLHTNQLTPLSRFCKEHKIKLMVPFTVHSDEFYSNPYIYAINMTKSDMYDAVNESALTRFANYNHVIIDAQDNDTDGQHFVSGMQKALSGKGINTRTLPLQADDAALIQALNPFRNNLLIPNSSSIKTLNLLFPKLKRIAKEHPEYRISLLGSPEWQTYTASQLTNFYAFNTYVITSFYRNPLNAQTGRFEKKFQYWFKKPLLNAFPRFGMLGFDAGYYFLHGMARYGASFNDRMPGLKVNPYQHAFRFQRVSNWSGFINRKIQLIHYTPEQTIELIDVQP